MRHKLTACVAVILAAAMLVSAATGCRRQAAWKGSEQEAGKAQVELSRATIDVGGVSLSVEVAANDATRMMGYMYRDKPVDSGMLFVYPEEQVMAYHMKNVKFDIDIAFITTEGRLDQIEHMKAFMVSPASNPESETRTWNSLRPAQYALEVPAGWFAEHNVAVGAQVKIPESVKAEVPEKAEPAKEGTN